MYSSLLNESFFSFGFNTASLSFSGIQPDCNDLLTILVIKGRRLFLQPCQKLSLELGQVHKFFCQLYQ